MAKILFAQIQMDRTIVVVDVVLSKTLPTVVLQWRACVRMELSAIEMQNVIMLVEIDSGVDAKLVGPVMAIFVAPIVTWMDGQIII